MGGFAVAHQIEDLQDAVDVDWLPRDMRGLKLDLKPPNDLIIVVIKL